jgi:hypothetical protein
MVGTRRSLLGRSSSYGNENTGPNANGQQHEDVESGYGSINPVKQNARFRDAIKQTMYDRRGNDMKKKLIDNVDHKLLEHFRKSDESVSPNSELLLLYPCTYFADSRHLAKMHIEQKAPRILRRTKPTS